MPKKPSETLKQHLAARATKALIEAGKNVGRLTAAQKKTPSEKRSEAMRTRLRNKDK